MNCFTHALPFLDKNDPYFVVGSCIPDWLSASDRKCRARRHLASEFIDDNSMVIASLAQGVIQHHQDDHWFHQTRSFSELSMRFSVELRERLGDEAGFRPGLLGHIFVEVLLDAYLHVTNPGCLERFYEQVNSVDPNRVQESINHFVTRPTDQLTIYIKRFIIARYLFDYVEDAQLLFRINNVLNRVKLKPLGRQILSWIPPARKRVYDQASDLLTQYNGKYNGATR